MESHTAALALCGVVAAARYQPDGFTLHSLRIVGATHLSAAGASEETIEAGRKVAFR